MRGIGLYVFVATFAAAIAITTFVPVPWEYGAGLFGVALFLSFAWHCGNVRAGHIALLLFAVALADIRMIFVPSQIPDAFLPLLDHKVVLSGVVVQLPDIRETTARVTLRSAVAGESTDIIAAVPLYPPVHVGDELTVTGPLKKPKPFDGDGGRVFPYDEFLRKDGVFAVMNSAQATITGQSPSLWLKFLRILESIKNEFMSLIGRALPEPENALAAGILVGGKQGLGTKVLDEFALAGMLQIVVLSGYNVMIVANSIMRALVALPKRFAAIVAGASIICFVLAAGGGSSALRSGIMALFAILARTTGKQYDVLRVLTIALFLLVLWNPLMLVYDPGFQFSFLATLGLIIGSPLLLPRLMFLRSSLLIEMTATTLAAQIGVLPLLLWQTGNLSLVALIANIIAMPVIPFAMAASALAALVVVPLGFISSALPTIAGLPAYLALTFVIRDAQISAKLPYANVVLPAFSFWFVIISYALLAWFVVHLQRTGTMPFGIVPVEQRAERKERKSW